MEKRKPSKLSSSRSQPAQGAQLSHITVPGIAEQLCYLSSQSKDDQTELEIGIPISKKVFGKPNRLFSEIVKRAQGDTFTIDSISHAFPIKLFFYVPANNTIEIVAKDFNLSRTDRITNEFGIEVDQQTINRTIKQSATFNITTGEINLKLNEESQKVFYMSQYKAQDLFTPNAKITLDPYTTQPEKRIKQIQRTQTFLSKLDGEMVNIFSYLNANPTVTSGRVEFDTPLGELKGKLEEIRPSISSLESRAVKSNQENLEIKQFKFVEKNLESEEKLQEYKTLLKLWYDNYNSWAKRKDQIASNIINHNYLLEFRKVGQEKLSNYLSRLVERTAKYDSRIQFEDNEEEVYDYTRHIYESEQQRQDKLKVGEIREKLNRAIARQNEKEIARYQTELAVASSKAKVSVKDRIKSKVSIRKIVGEYGLYPPYLVSDILRYGSNFMVPGSNIIDALGISSENISTFIANINGFKSFVFHIVSLFNQLVEHKLANSASCVPNAVSDIAKIIVGMSFSSEIYPELSWLDEQKDSTGESIEFEIPKTIQKNLMFQPCQTASNSLSVLAAQPADPIQPVKLLTVDEPLYGEETGRIFDFDLINAQRFGNTIALGRKTPVPTRNIAENLLRFLENKYNYIEDINPDFVEIKQEALTAEDFPGLTTDLELDSETSEKIAKARESSVNLWSRLNKDNLASSEPVKLAPKPVSPISPRKPKPVKEEEPVYDSDFDFEPVIITKSSASNEQQVIKIKGITKEGFVMFVTKTAHDLKTGDMIRFIDLEGTNTSQFMQKNWHIIVDPEVKSNIKLKDFTTQTAIKVTNGYISKVPSSASGYIEEKPLQIISVSNSGVVQLSYGETHDYVTNDIVRLRISDGINHEPLQNENWVIDVDEGVNTSFKIRGFNVEPDKQSIINVGTVTKIPRDLIDSSKSDRKYGKDPRDKPVEKQTAYKQRHEKLKAEAIQKYHGFGSKRDFEEARSDLINKTLSERIFRILTNDPKFLREFPDPAERKRVVEERVARLLTNSPSTIGELRINELGKFVKNNSQFVELVDARHPDDFEVEKLIEKTVKEWIENLDGKLAKKADSEEKSEKSEQREKSKKSKSSKSGRARRHDESDSDFYAKYLKYKAKYMALKTKLGL